MAIAAIVISSVTILANAIIIARTYRNNRRKERERTP